jgi:hypothetical protein
VPAGNGVYRLVNRNSAAGQGHEECLTVPNSSTANSTQLTQSNCNGTAAQSFQLIPQP